MFSKLFGSPPLWGVVILVAFVILMVALAVGISMYLDDEGKASASGTTGNYASMRQKLYDEATRCFAESGVVADLTENEVAGFRWSLTNDESTEIVSFISEMGCDSQ